MGDIVKEILKQILHVTRRWCGFLLITQKSLGKLNDQRKDAI